MIDLHTGDCRDVLKRFDACSFDACVTDPPYHLTQISRGGHARTNNPDMPHGRHRIGDKGFMGKVWDGGGVAFDPETWREVYRVLKPGAHLLAFGGTRTYHRMTCAIEDAGFEIRDSIAWIYGSGFPKSLDVSKAIDKAAGAERELTRSGIVQRDGYGDDWDTGSSATRPRYDKPATDAAHQWQGWGTALKPALEPIVLARKPLDGTVAENVCRHGTGALNVDGCRIGTEARVNNAPSASSISRESRVNQGYRPTRGNWQPADEDRAVVGRWPANLITDGSEEVVALFPTDAGAAAPVTRRNADKTRFAYGAFAGNVDEAGSTFQGDTGSAARFFYTAKVSASERGRDNTHPTVKPLDLMRYLCKLVTPPGGSILDPFAGSGSTAIAAAQLDMHAVCIDLEARHVDIQANRIRDELGMLAELRRHEAA